MSVDTATILRQYSSEASRKNTSQAIRHLITTMQYRDATQAETDLEASKRYEQARRSVTYNITSMFSWVEKMEAGTLTEGETKYFKKKPTADDAQKFHDALNRLLDSGDAKIIEELSDLRKEVYGRVIPKEIRDSIGYRLYALRPDATKNIQRARVFSDFYRNSRKFNEIYQKDGDYWDSTVEMAARAFACYIADKTGARNDYLSAHSDSAVGFDVNKSGELTVIKAFPEGQERIAINAAFDSLFAALKDDGFLHRQEDIEKPGVVQYQSRHLSGKSLQEWHRNYKNQEDSFSKDIDVWNREGRPPKATFLLGSTGDVLQGLGAIESDIYMLGDKISIILEKHKEMTLNEIKRIPEILNDPVMILKSRNVGRGDKSNTRIVVFGSLKAQNGQPVLAVMDLRPVEKGFRIDNMQKIDSAYTKTASRTKSMAENGRAFVKSSDVLYLDKKRTTRLLSAIGFYMPITCNRSGYIGSISYNGENVNIRGAKFSDVISESFDLEQEQRRDYIDEGYATDSTNWAYENFIIDETDRARFYEVIADLNKRNYSVPRNKNGVYMIEHENKIMFTDGDFKAPTLSKVIVFDTNYDANMAYAKGLIFDEERRTAGHGEALRAIEDLFGEGYVSEYNSKIYKPDAWKNRGREREDGRGIDQEVQDQERTSPLTDRDVLEAAANDVGISDMSDAEQAALQTFKDRLTELHELQEKRAEAGRLYKEQQFGANVDRQAARSDLGTDACTG